MTHRFLSNANFASKISLSDQTIFFNQFINPSPVKFIGCCYRSSKSLFITQIRFCSFTVLHLFAQRRTVLSQYTNHHHEKLAYVGEFRLEQGFCSPKLNHGTLLKSHRPALSQWFCFMQNRKGKTFQHSDLVPTDVLTEKLQNVTGG